MNDMNYAAHRQKLLNAMPPGSVALIASGSEKIRNRDVEFPFRADSDFLYLTGLNEPDCVLVLIHQSVLNGSELDKQQHQAWLFLRDKDPEQETWQGRRLGVDAAPQALSIDQAWCIDELDEQAPNFLTQAEQVFFSFGQMDEWTPLLTQWLSGLKAQVRKGLTTPTALCDLDQLLHEQRLFKTQEEIGLMRQAAIISVAGHKAAMRAVKTAEYEYQVQSALEHEFRLLGSERVAFNTIAACGENACILHYTDNDRRLASGELILMDAGAEYQGYAGDITHTFPVSGRFSEAQKTLYELVLAAQQAAIAQVRPGNSYDAMHQASVKVLTQGLIDLGLLKQDFDTAIKEQSYKRFFMHGTGHWLGRDVHDVGRYKIRGEWRDFEPGMLVTVEPGLYIPKGLNDVDAKWQGIGIRIEDDVLVTESGHEILTRGLPRSVEEIEAWMNA